MENRQNKISSKIQSFLLEVNDSDISFLQVPNFFSSRDIINYELNITWADEVFGQRVYIDVFLLSTPVKLGLTDLDLMPYFLGAACAGLVVSTQCSEEEDAGSESRSV